MTQASMRTQIGYIANFCTFDGSITTATTTAGFSVANPANLHPAIAIATISRRTATVIALFKTVYQAISTGRAVLGAIVYGFSPVTTSIPAAGPAIKHTITAVFTGYRTTNRVGATSCATISRTVTFILAVSSATNSVAAKPYPTVTRASALIFTLGSTTDRIVAYICSAILGTVTGVF